jgi:hypothetical protein
MYTETNMFRLMSGILAVALVAGLASASLAAKGDAKAKKTPEQRFAKADRNGDKKLSLDEFVGKREGDKKDKATRRFDKLDKDGDKFLSLEEFNVPPKKKK